MNMIVSSAVLTIVALLLFACTQSDQNLVPEKISNTETIDSKEVVKDGKSTSRRTRYLGLNPRSIRATDFDPFSGDITVIPRSPSDHGWIFEDVEEGTLIPEIQFLHMDYFTEQIIPDERPYTVIFVLDKPISSSSSIVTEHQFERMINGKMTMLPPFKRPKEVNEDTPSLVAIDEISAGGRGGFIHHRLFVDGKLITERKSRIVGEL